MMAQMPEGDPAPNDGLLPADTGFDPARTFHAYVHVPFCRVRCGYCDFNTYTASELRGVSQATFASQLNAEVDFSAAMLHASDAPSRKLESVFFGGGTPTQLPARDLVGVLRNLDHRFGLADGAEITTEANPDNVDLEYLVALRDGGFTRVSFGMQSAVPAVLATLDRTHNPERVSQVVAWAKQAGLQTSVDLIYGAPNETIGQWRASIDAAIALETDHISAYSLIVEPGTKMARLIDSGRLPQPDEDEQAVKYEMASEAFETAGFQWYELSNWAKSESARSRHNISYWSGADWWGYGPGAHSHVAGVRWWNVKHPAPYTQALAEGRSPAMAREVLTKESQLEEQILLRIRMRDGLPVETLRQAEAFDAGLVAGLIADGLVEPGAALRGVLVLTLQGRLLADMVVSRLLR
ncbi:MAG: radical SAM family heme chaperone HemW [Micrococcales bacterium]